MALFCAAVTGWVDQHSVEVQLPALLVLATALSLSWLQPRAAWCWWLIATLSIPAAAVVGSWVGHAAPFPATTFGWCVAAIPAGMGAILGVALAGPRARGHSRSAPV